MSTLKEIAKTCGVATSTVSRAFDENSRISQQVRQRILDYAAEVGYTPNLIARSLKKNCTMTVAIIIPSIENSFYIDALQHIEAALKHYGYRLLVSFVQNGITTERECLELMVAAQVDAIIILPQNRENEQYVYALQNKMKLIQLFNAPFECIDSVVMDDEGGAEAGANYLIRNGHRRILYLGGEERAAGFLRAVDAAGIPRYDVLLLPSKTDVDTMCNSIEHFRPTAVFAISWASEIAWRAIETLELSIPRDISVIVYDNTKWVSLMGLTAVAHNLEEIAAALVQQLVQRLEIGASGCLQHTVLNPFIIERKSVRPIV